LIPCMAIIEEDEAQEISVSSFKFMDIVDLRITNALPQNFQFS
jgi:hypothetical protein